MPLTAAAWSEADGLFRDDRWRGSDDAYSIKLDGDRVLWLFGDTFIAKHGSPTRVGSSFIRNSVAVQTGLDPLTATMDFAWGGTDDEPADYFSGDGPGSGAEWLWPGHGVWHDGRLLLFFMACDLPPDGDPHDPLGISFRVTGWRGVTVTNPQDLPGDWRLEPVDDRPDTAGSVLGAAALVEGDDLFLWAYREGHALLARTDIGRAVSGDLTSLRWWSGSEWVDDAASAVAALDPAVTEFTVHRAPDGRLVLVDVHPVTEPSAAVCVRRSDDVTGPWSARVSAYPIPEAAREDAFVYAGKAHPELSRPGEGLVVTYASNGRELAPLYADESLYYPRFARITGLH